MVAATADSGGLVDPANDQGGVLSSVEDPLNRGEIGRVDVAPRLRPVETVQAREELCNDGPKRC